MRRVMTTLALSALLVGVSSCAAMRSHRLAPLKIRLAVLDFAPPDERYNDEEFSYKAREGWGFGSSDVYTDAHVGVHVADEVARRLNRTELITVVARNETRQYLAGKMDILRSDFPEHSEVQRKQMLQQQMLENAVAMGRELNVDRVLTGQVVSERMSMNRATKFWRSNLTVRLIMWDVTKEEVVFDRTFSKNKFFASAQLTIESFADTFADWLADRYGYR